MKKEEYDETEEISEEIVEENKFQEILKNKKIMIPVIVGVALLMIFFLFSKPKEEKAKEVKSSDKIDTSELYTNNNDFNNPLYQNQYQGEQSNLNPLISENTVTAYAGGKMIEIGRASCRERV